MITEYVTLPHSATAEQLAALLELGGAALKARRGTDAGGQARVIISIEHPDAGAVAATRQALLRACQQARIPAFVV